MVLPGEVCLRDENGTGSGRGGWYRLGVVLAGLGLLVSFAAYAAPAYAFAGPANASAGRPAALFPTVTAEALDKQRITLPSGLEGQVNLLLLSFAPDQANQVDTWTAAAQALQHTNFNFRAYRMPVAERENAVFRWWANASLRSDETDPELWHWMVPLYVEKAAFRAQLGIADEKSVVALLVDKSGRILWRATGASSPGSRAGLAAAAGLQGSGTR